MDFTLTKGVKERKEKGQGKKENERPEAQKKKMFKLRYKTNALFVCCTDPWKWQVGQKVLKLQPTHSIQLCAVL